jgi:EAL domain-containing protein (putative c-di-GMP-specific phosphodiesterase class I)
VALDEFGAGPASLTHLRQLPIDMVKISRTAAAESGAEGGGLPLLDVIVGVGRRLGVDVVARDLEDPEQLAAVRTAGCRLGQGQLFASPAPAERTEAFLAGFPTRS